MAGCFCFFLMRGDVMIVCHRSAKCSGRSTCLNVIAACGLACVGRSGFGMFRISAPSQEEVSNEVRQGRSGSSVSLSAHHLEKNTLSALLNFVWNLSSISALHTRSRERRSRKPRTLLTSDNPAVVANPVPRCQGCRDIRVGKRSPFEAEILPSHRRKEFAAGLDGRRK